MILQEQDYTWCHSPLSTIPLALHLAQSQDSACKHIFPLLHKPAWTLQLVTLTTGTAQSLPQCSSHPPQGQLFSSSALSKLTLSLRISRVNMGQARR